jgi:hypothetical protein
MMLHLNDAWKHLLVLSAFSKDAVNMDNGEICRNYV